MSPDAKRSQLDADAADSMTNSKCNSPVGTPDNSVKGDKKKRSFIPRIFGSKRSGKGSSDGDLYRPDEADGLSLDMFTSRRQAFMEASPVMRKSFSERQTNPRIEGLNLSGFELSMAPATEKKEISMFVSTWNAGGRTPDNSLNLEDFLQVENSSDVYVLGFQEVVPLNAGNVLVVEDNEPAAKWLILINQALNRPNHRHDSDSSHGGSTSSTYSSSKDLKTPTSHNFFHKPSLKVLSRNFRADNTRLKSCNCPLDDSHERDKQRPRKITDPSHRSEATSFRGRRDSAEELLGAYMDLPDSPLSPTGTDGLCYRLIASKQMVGIFLTVWARSELVQYIGHLRVSTVGRGIMGRLGNKGCISVSMTLHETSFCFVCSHLASGEKEGDELKRNSDVIEILKNTQFSKICKNSCRLEPQKIMDHDRIIWMGDLNYRLSMSYEDTRSLLENNDWDTLLEKDQLNMERQAGRVFAGFREGKIHFAPTYKYSQNSDSYAGETVKSKKKRRTPAWCDRILWRGQGIEQLSYDRGESRFSDHRPVSSMFTVNVEVIMKMKFRKGFSCAATRLEFMDYIPQRHSFYEY